MKFDLPGNHTKATFGALYSQLELQRAVLKTYTKPLFFWRKALSRSTDGHTLYEFARHTLRNCDLLHRELSKKTFSFRPGVRHQHKLDGKIRELFLFPWEERIVDALLFSMLSRKFDKIFSSCSYAYRRNGFGVDVCQRNIARRLRRLPRPLYIVKRDISQYFSSVPHSIMLNALASWVNQDDYLFELLESRVRFRFQVGDKVLTAEKGLPFGTPIACFMANMLLTPLDWTMEANKKIYYVRYADDFLILSDDEDAATRAADDLETQIGTLGLLSKPSHHLNLSLRTHPYPLGTSTKFENTSSFRHLGLLFTADSVVRLSRDKQRKICNQFRFAFRRHRRKLGTITGVKERARYLTTVATGVVEASLRSVAILDYYLKHVEDERQLANIDRWLAEEILALATKKGHRRGNFQLCSYETLRDWGLPSLVHRKRLLAHGHLKSSFFVLKTERLLRRAELPPSGSA